MKYSGSLVKIEREKIFSLFLEKYKLKFADIEKAIKIRSNMVAYHLRQMENEGIIKKKSEHYFLTEKGEKYLPIFSHVTGKEMGPVPVALVAVMNKSNDKILLIKREKRPYKDLWSMIGGKIKIAEDFDEASIRLVQEKSGLKGKFVSLNAIMHEKIIGNEVKHSFILFLAKVEVKQGKANENLKWFNVSNIPKNETIPSDYWLIKNKLQKKIAIVHASMNDEDGKISNFKIKKKSK